MADRTGPGARWHVWIVQVAAVSVLAGGGLLSGTAPAWADAPANTATPVGRTASVGTAADEPALIAVLAADEARAQVLRLAKSGLPAELRTSAWNVLRSTGGDAAIAEWLAPGGGYDAAKQRLRDTRSRNRAFCERVVLTHPVAFSPQVRATAERALKGTDADRAAFVQSGYAQAQLLDRAAREADEQHRLEIAEQDRVFVRSLAEHDAGEHVRVAAQWAVRPGSTDADIVEFFGYGWATGAALDMEAYRLRTADSEVRRHHVLSRLIAQAAAAERALETAADVAEARAEAERAWRAVADHADAAYQAWLAEREAARAQAETWGEVAEAAKAAVGELWKNITAPAEARQDDWAKEQTEAGEAADYWKVMFEHAQESETRVKG